MNEATEKQIPRWLRLLASYGLGLFIGVVFHYTLYRMNLPQTPFIYQSF